MHASSPPLPSCLFAQGHWHKSKVVARRQAGRQAGTVGSGRATLALKCEHGFLHTICKGKKTVIKIEIDALLEISSKMLSSSWRQSQSG